MLKKNFLPYLIIFIAMLAGVLAWANLSSPLRPVIIFLFMLIAPGLAFTRLFHLKEILVEIVLAIALSLAVSTTLAELLLFTHLWSPDLVLGILVVLSLVGAILQIREGSRKMTHGSI